jgi:hypothetical protein
MNMSKPAPPLPAETGEHVLLERDASGGDEDGDEDEDAGSAKGKARPVRQVLLGRDRMRDLRPLF